MRCVLPIVLVLAAAPVAALAEPVCHAIRRGESAVQVARRVTGDGRNAYRPWFEIKNRSSRSVPKSQYNRIRAGWQACVVAPAIPITPPIVEQVVAVEAPLNAEPVASPAEPAELSAAVDLVAPQAPPMIPRAVPIVDLTMLWIGAAMVVPWFGWRVLDGYLVRRRTASIVMHHFARRFIDEFERPLVRYEAAERPVRSRLRCSAGRGRLEILIAPGKGRCYPNLSDHKQNIEYDVTRVIHALADDSFVSGALYTQADWVVVPFSFKPGPKQPGVTCISSL